MIRYLNLCSALFYQQFLEIYVTIKQNIAKGGETLQKK